MPPAVEVLTTGLPENPSTVYFKQKDLFREMVACVIEEAEMPTSAGWGDRETTA